jgi:hypothetical protein
MTMNNTDLPPIPSAGEYGPQVCDTVRLYLAVLDDLTPEQVNHLLKHVSTCSTCTVELHLVSSATRLVASLPATAPSHQVDSAILAVQSTQIGVRPRNVENVEELRREEAVQSTQNGVRPRNPVRLKLPRRRASWIIGQIAVAAVLLFACLTATHFVGIAPGAKSFELPANLSWNSYVLYHSETRTAANGMLYRVDCYHDLGSDRMHVETTAYDQLDVVVVGDHHAMLGKDMLHHVAQWGADAWAVDDSLFDLAKLRHELQTNAATYLDKDNFKGQEVYRIRFKDGLVLLLDMNYMPVNVLRGAVDPGTGTPIYDSLKLLPAAKVPVSMWDMSIPAGFQMGTLPARP